jgi:hypothetical protein
VRFAEPQFRHFMKATFPLRSEPALSHVSPGTYVP